MKYPIALCCSLLLSIPVIAQPAVLLGPDLEPVPVRLESISSEAIRFLDGRGEPKNLTPDDVLRLSFSSDALPTPDADRAVVNLRDGQVLVGKLLASNDDEAVRLQLDADRAVRVPLDEMLSLVIDHNAAVPAAEEDDALLLATGEVLLGFVETITTDAIGFVIGDSDDAIEIPMQRIKALSIANKPRLPEIVRGMMRVTTADGSVMLIEDATLSNVERVGQGRQLVGKSTLPIVSMKASDDDASTAASARMSLPVDRIVTIEPVSPRYRLTPLSDHDWRVVSGGEVFGVAMPPRTTAEGNVRLHAPVGVAFDLPRSASRLAFTVSMDLDAAIPEPRRTMAGCELVVYVGDDVVEKHILTADGPAKRINIPLKNGDLRIVLNPGVNGPVLDRVLISRGELLVSN